MDEQQRIGLVTDLVEQHYAMLYRYAYRLSGSASDAEDLTQQTFLTAQSKIGQLRDPTHAKGWLCAVLRNQYLKSKRSAHARLMTTLDHFPEPSDPTAENLSFDSEELQSAINEMPEEFRTPIILFYFEEFSYQQIADQMGVPIGTIMSRLARAKASLRGRLSAREPALMDR